jgi:hypothetical protein
VLNDVLCDNRRDFHVLGTNKRQIVLGRLCLLANGIACTLLLIFLFDSFVQDEKCSGVICADGRWGRYVAQFSECDSEWGSTLGVVKTRSYFRFSCGGDHVFDDGSDIKDGAIQLILLWGFAAAEKQAS